MGGGNDIIEIGSYPEVAYLNVVFRLDEGATGWPDEFPFVGLVTGSVGRRGNQQLIGKDVLMLKCINLIAPFMIDFEKEFGGPQPGRKIQREIEWKA